MNADDKKPQRDSLSVKDEPRKPPPRDRDQSPISTEKAHDIADRAEFSETPEAQAKPDKDDEPLIGRDNMQGARPHGGSTSDERGKG